MPPGLFLKVMYSVSNHGVNVNLLDFTNPQFATTLKLYRTPPSNNRRSSATHKCCGVELMISFVYNFFSS